MSKKSEKERQQVLARLGRETIIKNGTYDIDPVRHIDPDHPERNESERLAETARHEGGSAGPMRMHLRLPKRSWRQISG